MAFDTHGANGKPWTGFDLDGTLAVYDKWRGVAHIGKPVKPMCDLIRKMHDEGKSVKILTARVAPREDGSHHLARVFIARWCRDNLGFVPPITHEKDALMDTLYDDRVKAVEQNTGKVLNMAKFKVGDTAFVFDDWDSPYDGRGGTVVKVDRYVHVKFRDGKVAQFSEDELTKTTNAVRNAVDEAGRPLRQDNIQGFKDADGKLIKVGDMLEDTVGTTKGQRSKVIGFKGTQIYLDSGWKISKSNAALTRIVNSRARSRNAVVQKALNARWRIIYKNLSGPLFPYGKETYSTREEAEKRAEELRKQSKEWGTNASYFVDVVGNSISANADTSVLRETAVNGVWETESKLEREISRTVGADIDVGIYGSAIAVGGVPDEASAGKVKDIVARMFGPVASWQVKKDIIGYTIHAKVAKPIPTNSVRSTNAVVAKALNARRVARNFTPQSEFEVGDVVRFRDSVRSVPHDETYTVVKVSGNNVTIKGGRDNSTSVEFKNNLETA